MKTFTIFCAAVMLGLTVTSGAKALVSQWDKAFNYVDASHFGYATHDGAAGGNYTSMRSVESTEAEEYLVAGYGLNALGGYDLIVWKYDSAGGLDSAFGDGTCNNGSVLDPTKGCTVFDGVTAPGDLEIVNDIAIQSDGKLVVVGHVYKIGEGFETDMVIWRFSSAGILDVTFNAGVTPGYAVYDSGGNDEGKGVAIQSDGKIVVTGLVKAANNDFAVWRYNSDGTIDTSFSGDGVDTRNGDAGGNNHDSGTRVVLDSSGRSVICGYSHDGANYEAMLWRYNPNGAIDNSFNSGETPGFKVFGDGGAGSDGGYGVAIQPDGKLLLTGHYGNSMSIWRVTPEGIVDTSFNESGTSGRVAYNIPGSAADRGMSVDVSELGQILIVGATNYGGVIDDVAIWLYTESGDLDTSFNSTGYISFDGEASGYDMSYKGVFDFSNDIVLVGSQKNLNSEGAIWKYTHQFQIVGLSSALLVKDIDGNNIGDGSDFGLSNTVDVYISNPFGLFIAKVTVFFSADRNWSSVMGNVDLTSKKAYISGLSLADGVSSTHSLYVPRDPGDDAVVICPEAESLDEVTVSCEGREIYREGDGDMSIVADGGRSYWLVSGLEGTGGISWVYEELPGTGQMLAGGLIAGLILAVPCLYIAKRLSKKR